MAVHVDLHLDGLGGAGPSWIPDGLAGMVDPLGGGSTIRSWLVGDEVLTSTERTMVTDQPGTPTGFGFPEPPVWLRIGSLDHRSVQQARQILDHACSRAGTNLVVDLANMDDQHELTMFALLTEAARVMAAHGGTVTALNPTGALAANLVPSDALRIQLGQSSPRPRGTLVIDIGSAVPAVRAV